MRIQRIVFEEVSYRAGKAGTCPKCGKRAIRKKKFWQTLNPFNRNKDDQPKSREEIRAELIAKIQDWKSKPVFHVRCE